MSRIRTSWWRRSAASGVLLAAASVLALPLQASPVQASPVQASTARAGIAAATPPARAMIPGRLPADLRRPATAQAGISITSLDGVYCTSVSNCWAVGEREASSGAAQLNQVLHWNGTSWGNTPVPNPAGSAANALNELFAVRCLTAKNCWTVGEDSKNGGVTTLNQALHWNGKKWSLVRTPNPAGTKHNDNNESFDVTCVSAANCWIVGDFGTPSSVTGHQKLLNQVLHWNGKRWSRVFLANPGGTSMNHVNSLFSVRCGSASNCNAAGEEGTTRASTNKEYNEAFHWNGKRWSQVRTPDPGPAGSGRYSQIDALACGSATSCWGAGSYGSNDPTLTSHNEILRWNGKKWTRVLLFTPVTSDNQLIGATCASTRNCWAVGSDFTGTGATVNESLHWNGKQWSAVFMPSPGGTTNGDLSTLLGVRCAAQNNCWAVGYKLAGPDGFRNEILHWNGTVWSVHSAPGS